MTTLLPTSIGVLEKIAGISDRGMFWTRFAGLEHGFTEGVAELRRMAQVRLIDDYPAYAIVADKGREYQDGEKIAVPYQSLRHGKLYSFYQLGSVEAHARKRGEDPDAAVARERSLPNGKLYYAFGLGASLTAWERPKEVVPGFEIGDTIRFEGKRFRIDRAPNNNVELVEVEA